MAATETDEGDDVRSLLGHAQKQLVWTLLRWPMCGISCKSILFANVIAVFRTQQATAKHLKTKRLRDLTKFAQTSILGVLVMAIYTTRIELPLVLHSIRQRSSRTI